MRVMALSATCKNKYTCIHIRNILMQKGNSKPILITRLDAIFNNQNTLCFVENISKHLMRIESSFYQELNGQRYLGLTDLVERWINFKYMDITMTNKFSMEQSSNDFLSTLLPVPIIHDISSFASVGTQ